LAPLSPPPLPPAKNQHAPKTPTPTGERSSWRSGKRPPPRRTRPPCVLRAAPAKQSTHAPHTPRPERANPTPITGRRRERLPQPPAGGRAGLRHLHGAAAADPDAPLLPPGGLRELLVSAARTALPTMGRPYTKLCTQYPSPRSLSIATNRKGEWPKCSVCTSDVLSFIEVKGAGV